jgi:uncharacterized protein YecE (DUF72 family)
MNIWVGTSGYNYPEWRGSFYPAKMSTTKMLPYYAARFSTVEINYSFYRMPSEKTLAGWDRETPPTFKLTLKAPKRITHDARLRNCAEPLGNFLRVAHTLGPKLGAILFQLPPFFKKDLQVFDAFLAELPEGLCATFEFRHTSWLDEEVYARLKAKNLALCIADSEKSSTPVQMTADYAYFRLRDEGYTEEDIAKWARTIQAEAGHCRDIYVYFKHEEAGTGPAFARLLLRELGLPVARE